MEPKKFPITLSLDSPSYIVVRPKQQETGAVLLPKLINANEAYNLTGVTTVRGVFKRPGEVASYIDCDIVSAENGEISLKLTSQVLNKPGRISAEIQITGDIGSEPSEIRSWTFLLDVQETAGAADIESVNEVGIIQQIVDESVGQILADINAQKIELDNYTTVKEQELDSHTGLKKNEIDQYVEDTSKPEIDVYASEAVHKIYGAYWDKNSDPNLVRTHDAVGMTANVGIDGMWVQNDFDNAPIFGQIGTVEDDLGNEFVRIPKHYVKKTKGANFRTWAITNQPTPGFYLPHCFWDFTNNQELPYIDVGKYKASLDDSNKLESKKNKHPLVSDNIVNLRTYAMANGIGYQQLDIHVFDMLQTLFYIEFATLNSQNILQGFTSGQYSSGHTVTIAESGANRVIVAKATASLYRVGQSIGIGTANSNNSVSGTPRLITAIAEYDVDNDYIEFDGDPIDTAIGNIVANRGWISGFSKDIAAESGCIVANDGKYPMAYRGIESLYGDIYQFVDGVNINDHQAWVCKDAANYESNLFAAPYEALSYLNSTENGYPSEMGYDEENPYAAFPVDVTGGSTTFYSDYYYQTTGPRIALVGGSWYTGATAGVSFWSLHNSSGNAFVYIGGRLLKKPLST